MCVRVSGQAQAGWGLHEGCGYWGGGKPVGCRDKNHLQIKSFFSFSFFSFFSLSLASFSFFFYFTGVLYTHEKRSLCGVRKRLFFFLAFYM